MTFTMHFARTTQLFFRIFLIRVYKTRDETIVIFVDRCNKLFPSYIVSCISLRSALFAQHFALFFLPFFWVSWTLNQTRAFMRTSFVGGGGYLSLRGGECRGGKPSFFFFFFFFFCLLLTLTSSVSFQCSLIILYCVLYRR